MSLTRSRIAARGGRVSWDTIGVSLDSAAVSSGGRRVGVSQISHFLDTDRVSLAGGRVPAGGGGVATAGGGTFFPEKLAILAAPTSVPRAVATLRPIARHRVSHPRHFSRGGTLMVSNAGQLQDTATLGGAKVTRLAVAGRCLAWLEL